MRHLLFAFIIFLAAIFLGLQLKNDPGYVLIAINQWTIETTVWVGLFALLFLFLVGHFLLRLCQKIASIPACVHQWRTKRQVQKAQATTRKGLIEFNEGYWLKAKNHLIQALPNTDLPLLNYLIAARAAQKMGDNQARDEYLRQAQQTMPDAKIAVELTQAELQLANHQWEQALATLRHLQDLVPNHPYVLKLLMELYQQIRDWPQLLALLPALKKNHILATDELERLQQTATLETLRDFIKKNQPQMVSQYFLSLPKALQNNPVLVTEYATFLLSQQDASQAEMLLRRGLSKAFNSQLIDLYGLLNANEQQLAFAESLLKKNAHEPTLQLALGRLCMAKQLWGKAKHYLEQSNQLHPSPMAYKALGLLHEQLNESMQACAYYKKGLELIVSETTY